MGALRRLATFNRSLRTFPIRPSLDEPLSIGARMWYPDTTQVAGCSLSFMPKRGSDADSRIFFGELVSLAASRLKATGAIKPEDRQAVIPFGEQTKLIGVAHTKFPNGGSWSYFVCPKCGRRAKKLWLADDAPRCRRCLEKLGVRYRAAYGFGRTERLRERDRRVDRLQAMLEGWPDAPQACASKLGQPTPR
jgi:hypothetical protein